MEEDALALSFQRSLVTVLCAKMLINCVANGLIVVHLLKFFRQRGGLWVSAKQSHRNPNQLLATAIALDNSMSGSYEVLIVHY